MTEGENKEEQSTKEKAEDEFEDLRKEHLDDDVADRVDPDELAFEPSALDVVAYYVSRARWYLVGASLVGLALLWLHGDVPREVPLAGVFFVAAAVGGYPVLKSIMQMFDDGMANILLDIDPVDEIDQETAGWEIGDDELARLELEDGELYRHRGTVGVYEVRGYDEEEHRARGTPRIHVSYAEAARNMDDWDEFKKKNGVERLASMVPELLTEHRADQLRRVNEKAVAIVDRFSEALVSDPSESEPSKELERESENLDHIEEEARVDD